MNRYSDCGCAIGEGSQNSLANPPNGISRKPASSCWIVSLDCCYQPQDAFLIQILDRECWMNLKMLRYETNQSLIANYHALTSLLTARNDPLLFNWQAGI